MPARYSDGPRTLGFLSPASRGGGRYGVIEAASGLLEAISTQSSWDRIIVWSETDLPPTINLERVEWRSPTSLARDVQAGEITLLHHVGLGPAKLAPARGSIASPIFTSVFPALSYEDQMGQHALEVMVQKTTHDTDVYPSECSRQASQSIREQLEAGGLRPNGRTRELVIPVGVDINRFTPCSSADRSRIRAAENLPADSYIAVVLTRFSPSDKADLIPLLLACAASHDGGKLRFVLLGGDDYRGAKGYVRLLKRYIAELGLCEIVQVKVVNDRDRIVQILRCADLFVSPADSVQETFGITPIEAMACGLPAIVSDWNGYRETVVNELTGYRIPTTFSNNSAVWDRFRWHLDFRKSHLALSQSVSIDAFEVLRICRQVAGSPNLGRRMATAARKLAVEQFGWQKVIEKYEIAWQDVTETSFLTEKSIQTSFDYFATFSHYATSIFSDEAPYQLTPFGRRIAAGGLVLPLLADLKDMLPVDLLMAVLEAFRTAPNSVGSLAHLGPMADTRFCVSWLVKQGFLEMALAPHVGPPC